MQRPEHVRMHERHHIFGCEISSGAKGFALSRVGLAAFMVEIAATWDAEAGVWTAVSKDVPGLVTEAATVEAVIERAKAVVPELLELNGVDVGKKPIDVPIHVVADYRESVRILG